jgi:hypothetical protein
MSDPTTNNIPTTDPALLAAQAKAGQAGVDAYNAAISTLQQQRQAAVSSAMTSAAARGLAEPGAGQDVGRMYDSRISQLQAGMGQFQADTAARGQRLSDYNAAVNSARNLIPGQVNIATAPIKAQGEFDVWKIGAEGRSKVDQINAQKELVAAQMEAAKLAAAHSGGGGGGGRGGGGGGTKLSGEALQSALVEGATNRLSQQGAAGREAAQAAPAEAAPAPAKGSGGTSGFLGKLFAPAVNPLLKIAQSLSKPAEGVGSGAGTGGGGGSWGGGGGGGGKAPAPRPTHSREDMNTYYRTGQMPGGTPTGDAASNMSRNAATAEALKRVMEMLGPHPAAPGTAKPTQLPGTVLQREAAKGTFRHLLPFQKQLPEWQSYGGRKLTTKEGILAALGEDEANPKYLEDAMLQTAGELRKGGYKFDDPALLAAIGRGSTYKSGMNLSELLASQAGDPARETAANTRQQRDRADKKAQEDEIKQAAADKFGELTGLPITSVGMDAATALTIAQSPDWANLMADLDNMNGGQGPQSKDDLTNALKKVKDTNLRRLLHQKYDGTLASG